MIERTSRPMTPEERAACDPTPRRARDRAADMRSAWHWGCWGVPLLVLGIGVYVLIVRGTMSQWWFGIALPLGLLGLIATGIAAARIRAAVSGSHLKQVQEAFARNQVEVWTFTIDRVWWNLADEDCDARLLRTTNGRYVFLGTSDWLDISTGDDQTRPMCPSRLQVIDDGVHFSLAALESPMIPLEQVPEVLPREVFSLPYFKVVVIEAGELPPWLRNLIEPAAG